ncbi:hypothetical protein GALMADRAFT_257845 [Galerina marginata CBS 339.88]|uniref:2'-phosphotransferase n=1 Tax=Galerina marginata (strain CBS 339.88) TaxID=685588 RepID=A0A067S9P4_GALM3|nr:hypothetical protein GALMADRAFT_257845 [Galerina marginata CBS 339.88]
MDPATSSDSLAKLTISGQAGTSATPGSNSKQGKEKKDKGKAKAQQNSGGQQQAPNYKPNPSRSSKLRGFDKDPPEVRISKTLSWLLRHGAQGEGLPMRKDGYVKIVDLIEHPKLKAQDVNLEKIKAMVTADSKQRYDLILESPQGVKLVVWGAESASMPTIGESAADGSTSQKSEVTIEASATSTVPEPSKDGVWWIKARQGHSIKTVELELKPINSVSDIPTGTAVHGTNRIAWEIISKAGLSKMKRNHIHLAQNVAGQNVVSGMRTSSQVLIFIDIQKALDAGFKFWLSDNGVVLTEGDSRGYLPKKFFSRVVDVKLGELKGWEGSQ